CYSCADRPGSQEILHGQSYPQSRQITSNFVYKAPLALLKQPDNICRWEIVNDFLSNFLETQIIEKKMVLIIDRSL
ncbi:MAG: hypothetical protein AABY22_19095, partial [Nanoarchaeota archaeon]